MYTLYFFIVLFKCIVINSLNYSALKSFLTTTAFAFLTVSCLSPVAFAGNPEDRETFLLTPSTPALKRKAEEDENSSKRTKLSPPEEFDVGKALVTLPNTVIDILSTFLSPAECFNLALVCKDLGKHLLHLPMWQTLLEGLQLAPYVKSKRIFSSILKRSN